MKKVYQIRVVVQTTQPTVVVQTTQPTVVVQTTHPTVVVQTTQPTVVVQTTDSPGRNKENLNLSMRVIVEQTTKVALKYPL